VRPLALALVLALALLAGCAAKPDTQPTPASPLLTPVSQVKLASPAFQDHAAIPTASTCDGAGTSPELDVTGLPANASTVALVVHDPDAPVPQAPQQDFTHWLAWNVPAANGSATLPAGKPPAGTVEGKNSGGGNGWTAPCPPQGSTAHRYFFTAYAVDGALHLPAGSSRPQLEAALHDHVLGDATLVGCYARAPLPATPC
jgi:Raf kinase inhibitor-like YbhB/YbcL family protein